MVCDVGTEESSGGHHVLFSEHQIFRKGVEFSEANMKASAFRTAISYRHKALASKLELPADNLVDNLVLH